MFKLSTYNPKRAYEGNVLFILNKGLNTGKPLLEPCPNCFVCECSTEDDKETLYWICFALWQSHKFRQHLIGSVILYIRKKELSNLLKAALSKNENRPQVMEKAVTMLKVIETNMNKYQDVTIKLQKLKSIVFRDLV